MKEHFIIPLLVAYLTASNTCTAFAARRSPRRSALAPAETINNYETVSPLLIYQSKETIQGSPHNLWIKFNLSGKPYELHLEINRNLLTPHYAESYMENGKMVFNKERRNCFYHGTVVGFPKWMVAMSTCAGLRGTFGNHDDIDSLYHIEPLEKTHGEIEKTHIVFMTSELSVERRNGTCGCKEGHEPRVSSLQNLTMPSLSDRVRRQSATRIVEWVIVNDRRQYIIQKQNITLTELRSIEIANTVDMLYAKIGIRISLMGVQIWSQLDPILVVSNPDTLLNQFFNYQLILRATHGNFDSSMLITGIDLEGQTVGIAPIGEMCTGSSAGLSQDTGSSVAAISSIAAHELGHIFDMEHDDERCLCDGVNGQCIMATTASSPPAMEWSDCSVSYLENGFAQGFDRCLFNEPRMTFVDPTCGNGIREGDEACDCGDPEKCDDPCCNSTTCQLADGAVCSNRELCCSNCQYSSSGTMCRAAFSECDIAEYCTGSSEECPDDLYQQNGADCAGGQAYCFIGMCRDLNAICQATYLPGNGVPPSVGPPQCFNFNTDGTEFGNCGHNPSSYLPCDSIDVQCGQLHCQNSGEFNKSIGEDDVVTLTQEVLIDGRSVQCSSFTTLPGSDIMPGLVPDGTKCGINMVCINHQCTPLSACPSANSQECSGNGVCNDLNQCLCDFGFYGTDCSSNVEGGGGTPKPNITGIAGNKGGGGGGVNGAAIGGVVAAVVIIVIIAIVVMATCALYRRRQRAAKFIAVSTKEPDFSYYASNQSTGDDIVDGSAPPCKPPDAPTRNHYTPPTVPEQAVKQPLYPQSSFTPQAPLRPQQSLPKSDIAPIPKPRTVLPVDDNVDDTRPLPTAPKKPLRPPTRN